MTGLAQRLRHVYWLMERRMVPGLTSAQRQYEAALDRCVRPSIRWLDVGCGRRLLGPWRSAVERALVARSGSVFGVDPDLASLRDNGSIWAFLTMFMRSIPQAIKHLAASALEGRSKKDVFPAYYRINSSSAIRDVAERRGFEVVSIDLISTAALFALVPPLAALELLWIRLLSSRWAARARPNIIAVLRKRAGGAFGVAGAPA